MNITPDYLVERKKYKSLIRNLKIISICLVGLVVFILAGKNSNYKNTVSDKISEDYIALVKIDDVIYEDYSKESKILKIKDDEKAKAVVVYINSPGGSAGGSERMYSILKSIREKKPVVAVMGSVAASGGYMISLAAEHIIAHNSTITGSIGVIFQSFEVTSLAEKMGVVFNNFKSSELKASPNPMEKLTPEAKEANMSTVLDVYDYFVDLVVENRKIDKSDVLKISDGRVYSGRQAYVLRLVDEIGTLENATIWLNKEKNIDKNLKFKHVNKNTERSIREMLFDDMFNDAKNYVYNLLFNSSQSKIILK